jgi:dinuclear metal center YbgI/SA1388 family protein
LDPFGYAERVPLVRFKISQVLNFIEEKAPQATAEKWDNVGLLVGDPSWETAGAVIADDLTLEAVTQAKEKGFKLILNHHPCIFPAQKGLSRVTPGYKTSSLNSLIFECIRSEIAVISCHTNFDQCALEVGQRVAEGLGMEAHGRLVPGAANEIDQATLLKLTVFVPEDALGKVREALFAAGAGRIGRYEKTSFSSQGEGTFLGEEKTQPVIGAPQSFVEVKERRLETVFPRGLRKQVLKALQKAHPYEEVAYDLFPVLQPASPYGFFKGLGYGVWGEFSEKLPFSELAQRVKKLFELDGYWQTPPRERQVRRVAFSAGSGGSLVRTVSQLGCDVFITGEVGYHGSLDADRHGVTVIELGHRYSELFFHRVMEEWLQGFGLQTLRLEEKTQEIG